MKRWPLRIILCLIPGAITTVAVAWGVLLPVDNWQWQRVVSVLNVSPAGRWSSSTQSDATLIITHERRWQKRYQLQRTAYRIDTERVAGDIEMYLLSGWPMLAMTSSDIYPGFPDDPLGILSECRIPVPLGFAINTFFYAAIWGGVFFGFTSAKRLIRIKRGRCPRCGYDLRGGVMSDKRLAMSGEEESATPEPQVSSPKPSPGCPECGWSREGSEGQRG